MSQVLRMATDPLPGQLSLHRTVDGPMLLQPWQNQAPDSLSPGL